jgi:hypothetical protein
VEGRILATLGITQVPVHAASSAMLIGGEADMYYKKLVKDVTYSVEYTCRLEPDDRGWDWTEDEWLQWFSDQDAYDLVGGVVEVDIEEKAISCGDYDDNS